LYKPALNVAKRLRHKTLKTLTYTFDFIPFPFGFGGSLPSQQLSFFPFFLLQNSFFMVYLIHFSEKLHHAQHYIGFVDKNLDQRIKKHRSNKGAKLLMAVNNEGIPWEVVRVWEDGNRELERRLKNRKKSRCICPICLNHH
jgi:predicted GIY-YIG superfamily endonuclease